MEILIDIPSDVVADAQNNVNYLPLNKIDVVWKAIAKGKVLPKNHGDLKDIQEVIKEMYERASELDSYGAYEEAEIVDFALNEFGKVVIRAERQRTTESEV